ncbi:MAG: UTP--glucose-1-phosphate uridylyltransferase GalU [Pseudomonadota bacterium]
MKPVKKAVFPVAGLGTRILPATKAIPKEMLTIIDKPLIQYAVEEALAAGIEHIIFVTGQGKSALEDHFDRSANLEQTLEARGKTDRLDMIRQFELRDGQISYVRQSAPLGLGHAVWCARHLVGDEPFAVLLPDDYCAAETPILKQMVDAYNKTGGNILAVTEVAREHTNKYGILEIGATEGNLTEVKGLVEKPDPEDAPSTLSVIGRYVLRPELFKHLGAHEKGAGGEIQLTDAMCKMIGEVPIHGLHYDGKRYDCGDKFGYVVATIETAMGHKEIGNDTKAHLKAVI